MARSPAAAAWAASGAMDLTGPADGPPLVPPDDLVDRIVALGRPLAVDALALLAERAAAVGLTRQGRISCGGAARLVRAADGWLAVNLPRPEDIEAVPAWLELDVDALDPDDPWSCIEGEVRARQCDLLVARAALLSLPVSRRAEVRTAPTTTAAPFSDVPVGATALGTTDPSAARAGAGIDDLVVVDLSSLWAGPLCTRLLADRGARVVKVESRARPDGARRGPPAFFDRLNAGKRVVVVDLDDEAGRDELRGLLDAADVVVEASRPRALRQLGIHAEDLLAHGRPRAWVSITGYGRDRDRVAFGDDAAVAGGLVADDGDGPCFVADAVADPLAGVAAARAAMAALTDDRSWLIDVAMADVAAHVAGPEARRWRPARCGTR